MGELSNRFCARAGANGFEISDSYGRYYMVKIPSLHRRQGVFSADGRLPGRPDRR